MNKLRNLWFPFMLALILGGLSAWLGRISEVVVEEVKLSPTEPQYQMQHIEAKRYDLSGELSEQLVAESAWQLPDQKNVFLKLPILRLFHQGSVQYSVSSQMARYELESKKIFFQDNVLLYKKADNTRPEAEIKTDTLQVDTVSQIAQTQSLVHYRYGVSQGTAKGLTYNHQNGQLNLPSRVRALIYDTP